MSMVLQRIFLIRRIISRALACKKAGLAALVLCSTLTIFGQSCPTTVVRDNSGRLEFNSKRKMAFHLPMTDIRRIVLEYLEPKVHHEFSSGYTSYRFAHPKNVPDGPAPACFAAVYGSSANGGSGTIALVTAYHDPTLAEDMAQFVKHFTLSNCSVGSCLQVINLGASTSSSPTACRWYGETALTIEWIHGMAPNAQILLVEANSEHGDDLFAAVDRAGSELIAKGGGELVMPWVIPEEEIDQATISRYEAIFKDGVTYFAATGDKAGLIAYPATSSKVVAIGGTKLVADRETGNIVDEIGWKASGGGESKLIPKPNVQNGIVSSQMRTAPDFAVNADGVPYYNNSPCPPFDGGLQYGDGTSVAAAIAAAIANSVGNRNHSSTKELTNIYAHFGDPKAFKDITSCGLAPCPAAAGYDIVTGVGAPRSPAFDASPPVH